MDRRSTPRVILYRAREPDRRDVYEVEYESVADALHFACRDLRAARREPIEILENGVLMLDAAAIAARCEEERQEMEELLEPDPERGAE